jgi:polar amino acid transport system substrate-binding protein
VKRVAIVLAAVATATTGVAACGSSSSGGSGATTTPTTTTSTTSLIAGCNPSTMHTLKSGVLTLGADKPVYPPWYSNNDPTNGKGYEDAVAYAIAKELGYGPSQVKWTRITFDQAITPAPKNFDYDLDEFSITPEREKVVDFSAPYYNVAQAVVAMKGTKAASVTTLQGLRALKLAAQIGSTSEIAINNVVKPSQSPAIYNNNATALQALKNGQVDGVVVDLPTAFYITSAQIPGSVIAGQLPAAGGKQEQFGALLNKNSPITACVSKAVNALRANGKLAQIQDKWLAQVGKAPVLQ